MLTLSVRQPWSGLLGFFDVDLSKINGGDTL